MDFADLDNHFELFDALLGPEQAKNRETRFDYNVGRDARPDSLRPGREFIRVEITTRNAYFNPVKFSWFYHSVPDRSGWFMTSLSFRAMWLVYLNIDILDKLPNLEYLDLQGNRLEKIDLSGFSEKPHLHTLNLSANQITSFDYDCQQLFPMLRILNLHDNELSSFDCSNISYNIELNRVILSRNHIKQVDLSSIGQLSHLFTIDLSENEISVIDESMDNPDLTSLLLSNNHISEFKISGYLIKMQYLSLYENNLKNLDFCQLDTVMPQLRRLHLWGNKLETVELDTCQFDNLEELNISGNHLRAFSLGSSCRSLQYLDLSYNNLTTFQVDNLSNTLTVLDLSFNPMKSINLTNLPKSVEEINLVGTLLAEIELPATGNIEHKRDYQQVTINDMVVKIPETCKIVCQK